MTVDLQSDGMLPPDEEADGASVAATAQVLLPRTGST